MKNLSVTYVSPAAPRLPRRAQRAPQRVSALQGKTAPQPAPVPTQAQHPPTEPHSAAYLSSSHREAQGTLPNHAAAERDAGAAASTSTSAVASSMASGRMAAVGIRATPVMPPPAAVLPGPRDAAFALIGAAAAVALRAGSAVAEALSKWADSVNSTAPAPAPAGSSEQAAGGDEWPYGAAAAEKSEDREYEFGATEVVSETNAESVEWVNMCWRKAWRVYQRGLEQWFSDLLQPVFDGAVRDYAPSWVHRIKILEFTLDHEPFTFSKMRRRTSRKDSDLNGVVDVRYTGGAKMLLLLEIGRGLWRAKVPVMVSDLDVEGQLWVKVRLAPVCPWIGTLCIGFVGPPKIRVQLAPFNRIRLMRIPVLQKFLNQLLTVDLPGLIVLPRRLEVNIPPSALSLAEAAVGRDTIMRAVASAVLQADAVEAALMAALPLGPQTAAGGISLPESFRGELLVNVREARNLPVWGMPWQSNPYCHVTVGSQVEITKKNNETSMERSGRQPYWNQEFQFLVEDPLTQVVEIDIHDNHITGRPVVGRVRVPLSMLRPDSTVNMWASVEPANGGQRAEGELNIELCYKPFVDDEMDSGYVLAKQYEEAIRGQMPLGSAAGGIEITDVKSASEASSRAAVVASAAYTALAATKAAAARAAARAVMTARKGQQAVAEEDAILAEVREKDVQTAVAAAVAAADAAFTLSAAGSAPSPPAAPGHIPTAVEEARVVSDPSQARAPRSQQQVAAVASSAQVALSLQSQSQEEKEAQLLSLLNSRMTTTNSVGKLSPADLSVDGGDGTKKEALQVPRSTSPAPTNSSGGAPSSPLPQPPSPTPASLASADLLDSAEALRSMVPAAAEAVTVDFDDYMPPAPRKPSSSSAAQGPSSPLAYDKSGRLASGAGSNGGNGAGAVRDDLGRVWDPEALKMEERGRRPDPSVLKDTMSHYEGAAPEGGPPIHIIGSGAGYKPQGPPGPPSSAARGTPAGTAGKGQQRGPGNGGVATLTAKAPAAEGAAKKDGQKAAAAVQSTDAALPSSSSGDSRPSQNWAWAVAESIYGLIQRPAAKPADGKQAKDDAASATAQAAAEASAASRAKEKEEKEKEKEAASQAAAKAKEAAAKASEAPEDGPISSLPSLPDINMDDVLKEVTKNLRLRETRALHIWEKAMEQSQRPWLQLLVVLTAVAIVVLSVVAYRLNLEIKLEMLQILAQGGPVNQDMPPMP